MGSRSNEEETRPNVREKRIYTNHNENHNFAKENPTNEHDDQRKYQAPLVPKISFNRKGVRKGSETLKEALIRDIGENISDADIEFISKFIAISGYSLSYRGTKEEQKVNFNTLIDNMIHQFPHLALKLSSVQLNYTMKHLIKSMTGD